MLPVLSGWALEVRLHHFVSSSRWDLIPTYSRCRLTSLTTLQVRLLRGLIVDASRSGSLPILKPILCSWRTWVNRKRLASLNVNTLRLLTFQRMSTVDDHQTNWAMPSSHILIKNRAPRKSVSDRKSSTSSRLSRRMKSILERSVPMKSRLSAGEASRCSNSSLSEPPSDIQKTAESCGFSVRLNFKRSSSLESNTY